MSCDGWACRRMFRSGCGSRDREPGVNRANRIMWSVIGVVLMALGSGGALISLGHMPGTDRDVTLWTDAMSNRWHRWGVWAPAVTAAAGLVIAVAGFALIA